MYRTELTSFTPEHDFFVGIDSDGCVFDSMEVKQKKFFIPNALKYFELYSISEILTKTWEFVNLYSVHRGGNRFKSLLKVFDLLNENKSIIDSGQKLPDMSPLRKWVLTESRLGNETLRIYLKSNFHTDLEKVMKWSEAINSDIAARLRNIPPFPHAVQAIKKISSITDLVIVSQTPLEALEREWEEHDLKKYVKVIAGQEHGTKSEHIAYAAKGKYPDEKILMIGDAIGDLEAAGKNNIHFYPIIPGREDESWRRFLTEGFSHFQNGKYPGSYENGLIEEFRKSLPETFH